MVVHPEILRAAGAERYRTEIPAHRAPTVRRPRTTACGGPDRPRPWAAARDTARAALSAWRPGGST